MWTYEQSTGKMYNPQNQLYNEGYSGHGIGLNNPLMQAVRNFGPLPIGLYYMDTPIDSPKMGPYAIPLRPDESNEMFGRIAFYIHGDEANDLKIASDGCIIQSPLEKRKEMYESGDHALLVVDKLDG